MAGIQRLSSAIAAFRAAIATPPAQAPTRQEQPLFISLTSDDGYRITLAFAFGGKQLRRGHPVIVFMNDRAVVAASRKNAATYAEQQALIAELMAEGTEVIVCPMCMAHYGIDAEDLLPGLRLGNPESTGDALFRNGTRALSW